MSDEKQKLEEMFNKLGIAADKEPASISSTQEFEQVDSQFEFNLDLCTDHLKKVKAELHSFIGKPGFNSHIFMADFVTPLINRLNSGEKSKDLQETILNLEAKPLAKGAEHNAPKEFQPPKEELPSNVPVSTVVSVHSL